MKLRLPNLNQTLRCCVAMLFIAMLSVNSSSAQTCPGQSYFDYPGTVGTVSGNWTYAQSDTAGKCYRDLVAGQTYCFSYKAPANGIIELDINMTGCSTCPTSMYGRVTLNSSSSQVIGGGSANSSNRCVTLQGGSGCQWQTYDFNCTVVPAPAGIKFGACTNFTTGSIYTSCFTVPATCGGMDICPMYRCINCAINPEVAVKDTAICEGECASITAVGSSGTPPYSYSWSNGETTATVNVCPTQTTDYIVVITDANNLTGTDTATITINPLPILVVSADTALCVGASYQLSASGGATYTWSPSAGLSADNIANPVATPTATTTYTVVATSAVGCTKSARVTITVNALPTINVTPDTSVCIGNCVQLRAEGASTYAWTPATGLDNPNIANPTACPTGTTTYTVTATNANGCIGTATVTVTVHPLPTVVFAPFAQSVCQTDAPFTLTNGTPAGGTYTGDGITNNVFDPAAAGVGSHILTYTYADVNGCVNSDTETVVVDPAGTVTIDPVPAQCVVGAPYTLTGSPAGGTFSGPGVTGNTFNPAAVGVGSYTIYYTFTASRCLFNTVDSTVVVVSPKPTVSITARPDPTLPCLPNYTIYLGYGPQCITLTANTNPAATSYQWYFNGASISGGTNQTYCAAQTGSYNVIAFVNGCPSDTSTNPINVHVVDVRCKNDLSKILVCHKSGNSGKFTDLCVDSAGVAGQGGSPGHLGHGDCLGKCGLTWRMQDGSEIQFDLGFKAYPNPFSGQTMIEFNVPEASQVTLEIYDMKGALVSKPFDRYAEEDHYNVIVDASMLPQGIYNAKLMIGDHVVNQKLMLEK